jgi:hypothetical protein
MTCTTCGQPLKRGSRVCWTCLRRDVGDGATVGRGPAQPVALERAAAPEDTTDRHNMSDFVEDTSPHARPLHLSRPGVATAMAAGAGAVLAGLRLLHQPLWAAVPLSLFLVVGFADIVQRYREFLPRSVSETIETWLHRRVFAQHLVLVMLVGLLGGHGLALAGFQPTADPVVAEEERQHAVAQAAASAFPERAPGLHRELEIIAGLIGKGNFRNADERLARVQTILRPVQRSYAGQYADVVEVQQHLDATRGLLQRTRQAVDLQQAQARATVVTQRLDAVDALLDRGRVQDASRAWVVADKLLTELHAPPAMAADEAALRQRADGQRALIRAGGKPRTANPESALAKPHGKKRLYTSVEP